MDSFAGILKEKVKEIEAIIVKYLPKEEGYQKTVIEAMNYSILAGGKRLRPMLMQETYRLFGGKETVIEPFMAAIEMIHTYSLVHDDLPAMDNDAYRRGRKTTHIVYGEAMGILAGDGLLNLAFETALHAFDCKPDCSAEEMKRIGAALQIMAEKAGFRGMIGGQTADIEGESKEHITTEELLFIHEKKTAALIQASMMVGAVLAGASGEDVEQIEKCAYNIGIAFQIQDDILDIVGNTQELGKPVGSDEKNQKQTYVTLNGLETSAAHVDSLSKEAIRIIEAVDGDSSFLRELIRSLIHRTK